MCRQAGVNHPIPTNQPTWEGWNLGLVGGRHGGKVCVWGMCVCGVKACSRTVCGRREVVCVW